MKIKQTLLHFGFAALLMLGISSVLVSPAFAAVCGDVQTSIINCSQSGGPNATIENTGVWGVLLLAINILTALVGLAAVGGVVYGSILYTSAGGNQEQVKKAMGIITNVVIGVITYALMFSVSNFLIPGGIFT